MRHICPLIVVTAAFVVLTSSMSQAAGSYQKKPMFPGLVKAGLPTPNISLPSPPQINPAQLLGGCGRGRVRDPQTNSCRGPGDFGH